MFQLGSAATARAKPAAAPFQSFFLWSWNAAVFSIRASKWPNVQVNLCSPAHVKSPTVTSTSAASGDVGDGHGESGALLSLDDLEPGSIDQERVAVAEGLLAVTIGGGARGEECDHGGGQRGAKHGGIVALHRRCSDTCARELAVLVPGHSPSHTSGESVCVRSRTRSVPGSCAGTVREGLAGT